MGIERGDDVQCKYETFVIRLWIEGESQLRHGEIRHLPSGTEFRFQHVEEAVEFINRHALKKRWVNGSR